MRVAFRGSAPALALLVALAAIACSGGGGDGGPPTGPFDGNPYDGTAVIGPLGGSVALGDGISVDIPAGALPEETQITISRVATPADLQAEGAIGQAYRIAPVDANLSAAARVSIFVPDAVLQGRPLSAITVLRSTGGSSDLVPAGEELGGVQRNGGALVSGSTNQFGTFSAAATEPPNRAPSANAGPDQTADTGQTVGLNGTGSDPDGDALTYSWAFQSRPGGSAASISNSSSASATFTPDVAGTYVLELAVSDGNGGTATDTMTVTVTDPPANQVVADAGPDQTGAVGQRVDLDGRNSRGTGLTYSWRFVQTPGGAPGINNATSARASFVPNAAGDYLVELTVTDGATADRDTVRISVVQPNRAPTVGLGGPNAVLLGNPVTITATTSDPDGDPLTLQFSLQAPGGSLASLSVNGNQASFTPDVPGTYTVRAIVSDGTVQTSASAAVNGNLSVAGSYNTRFRITTVNGNCGGFINVGDETTADMQVTQPNPGTVVLQLSAFSVLSSDATGTLQGVDYSFNGGLTFTDGGNPPTTITAQGTINGPFSANPMGLNLVASFSAAGGICQATASMTSPP